MIVEREVTILLNISHPHIANMEAFFKNDDCVLLVFDVCEGGLSLSTLIFLTGTALAERALTVLLFLSRHALTVLIFLTELVLPVLVFRTERVLTVLVLLTELVLAVLVFLIELAIAALTFEVVLTALIFLTELVRTRWRALHTGQGGGCLHRGEVPDHHAQNGRGDCLLPQAPNHPS